MLHSLVVILIMAPLVVLLFVALPGCTLLWHSLAVLLIVASLAVLLIMASLAVLLIVTLLGISVDCSGSAFDCDTLLMFFCSTLCMQILWYCLTVPMISALPGRTFDCNSSWKYF